MRFIFFFVIFPMKIFALEKIYKSEPGPWLKTEAEYGCEVENSEDFMSFGFNSTFLPGVTVSYWKHLRADAGSCGALACPPSYTLLWKKSFYKSDFEQKSVSFNGMSLVLKWNDSESTDSFLGDIRFFEKGPNTLRYKWKGDQFEKNLSCVNEKKEKPESIKSLVNVVRSWHSDLCEVRKKKDNPRLDGPSQIGSGGGFDTPGEKKHEEHP